MFTTPLLENDYLTAELIAKTLSIGQPANFATSRTSLQPSLSGTQITVKAGSAWIGGTLIQSTTEEMLDVTMEAKGINKKLLVLRVKFDGESQPELKLVPYSYHPNNTPDSWYQKPGQQVDFPIALLEKETYWWKLTDVRLVREAAVCLYMGTPTMTEVYAAPIGTFYVGNDDAFYLQKLDRGYKVTPPDNPDIFLQFSPSVIEKSKSLGTDISRLQYTQSNSTVHVVGQIPATGNFLRTFFPIDGMPKVLTIGHMGTGRPVRCRKEEDENFILETAEGLIPAKDINVDFQIIGKVDRNA